MDNLIGDDGVAQSVLSLFNDPEVGLVFADDRHIVDLGANKPYTDQLCEMFGMPEVENTHVFPLGNMFWARIEAIKQLFELEKEIILQPEPLPYDGSFMHALERVSPALAGNNGFKFVTVYREGTIW